MTRYSVQPRNQLFAKGSGFLSFAKIMGRNIGKNVSKYSVRKFLIMLNNLLQMQLKLLQNERSKNRRSN